MIRRIFFLLLLFSVSLFLCPNPAALEEINLTDDFLGLEKGVEWKYSFEFKEAGYEGEERENWEEHTQKGTATYQITDVFSREDYKIFTIETEREVSYNGEDTQQDVETFYAAEKDGTYYEFYFDPRGEHFEEEFLEKILKDSLEKGDEFEGGFGEIRTEIPLIVQGKEELQVDNHWLKAYRLENEENNNHSSTDIETRQEISIWFVPYLGFVKQQTEMKTFMENEDGERETLMEFKGQIYLSGHSLSE